MWPAYYQFSLLIRWAMSIRYWSGEHVWKSAVCDSYLPDGHRGHAGNQLVRPRSKVIKVVKQQADIYQ